MARSKAAMLEEMTQLSNMIMTVMLEEEVTIKPEQLAFEDECIKLKADYIRPAYKWLIELSEKEFSEVLRVKSLLSAELWQRYRTWGGFEEHREVILLKAALKTLRMAVVSRNRPDFYKRSKRAKKLNIRSKSSYPKAKTGNKVKTT